MFGWEIQKNQNSSAVIWATEHLQWKQFSPSRGNIDKEMLWTPESCLQSFCDQRESKQLWNCLVDKVILYIVILELFKYSYFYILKAVFKFHE